MRATPRAGPAPPRSCVKPIDADDRPADDDVAPSGAVAVGTGMVAADVARYAPVAADDDDGSEPTLERRATGLLAAEGGSVGALSARPPVAPSSPPSSIPATLTLPSPAPAFAPLPVLEPLADLPLLEPRATAAASTSMSMSMSTSTKPAPAFLPAVAPAALPPLPAGPPLPMVPAEVPTTPPPRTGAPLPFASLLPGSVPVPVPTAVPPLAFPSSTLPPLPTLATLPPTPGPGAVAPLLLPVASAEPHGAAATGRPLDIDAPTQTTETPLRPGGLDLAAAGGGGNGPAPADEPPLDNDVTRPVAAPGAWRAVIAGPPAADPAADPAPVRPEVAAAAVPTGSSTPVGGPALPDLSPAGASVREVDLPVPDFFATTTPSTPSASAWDDGPFPPIDAQGALDEQTADIEIARGRLDRSWSDDGRLSTDEGVTVEGAPVEEQRTDLGPTPPAGGTALRADDGTMVQLEDSLGEQGGMVFYRARLARDGVDLGLPFTAVWTPQAPPEPPWPHLPDARLVRPRCRVSLDRAAVRVFDRPKGNTVVDYLADDERLLPAMATIELGIELAELLEGLHGAGCHLYDVDPSQIVIEKGGRVRLYAVGGLYRAGQLPAGSLGLFTAPEVRRRMSYRIGQSADVFAVALLLYALLAKRAPLETDTDPAQLVSPRVFRPECPLGIWPLLRPCLDPNPGRRIGHARGLRQQLERIQARLLAEAKATEEQVPVLLESWAELHTGITKARRGSNQQDRALAVTDETARTGLYVIADGVSRSKFGDGAFAAEQVETAALQRWSGLEKGGPQALELQHPQRADILKQVARSAGKKIAAEINGKYAPIPNEPNQVMSATMVAAFVVNGDATIGNLGDSRAYLVRDGIIEQISIDHDRCTDALRLGLSFREAAQVQMGTALTRVVGRVVIDEDGTCRADPFEPELFRLRLLPGDRIVLCSDGVADFVAGPGQPTAEQDEKIKQTVLEHEDPARAAFELVVLANRVGGYDNISCVILAVHPG
jgi:serine/threonine protein phosphatase PrpC